MARPNSSSVLALPFAAVLATFFVLPLILVVVVSFWDYTEYSLIPDFILMNYEELFYGCFDWGDGLCTTFATYLSTFKYVLLTWFFTLVIGFGVALFLVFCVRSL
ncbi:MAG: ABC transporter permease, partial [Gammaproteobacteria bacterium]|nr:ABC transporter permease [Gammaproteobacteria bacterium]